MAKLNDNGKPITAIILSPGAILVTLAAFEFVRINSDSDLGDVSNEVITTLENTLGILDPAALRVWKRSKI